MELQVKNTAPTCSYLAKAKEHTQEKKETEQCCCNSSSFVGMTLRKLKKGGKKTYQWKDYEVVATSDNSITLRNAQGEELVLQGKYARRYRVGDLVKYDALNDIIKKRRKD